MVRETHGRRCCLLLVLFISGWNVCEGQSACVPNPCLNNGTCGIATDSQSLTCSCKSGFTGSLCETEVTSALCTTDYCHHGGTCYTEDDVNKCACTRHYIGTRCEGIRRHCVADNPCQNEALCEDIHDGGYTCYCLPGYYGDNCDLDINECQSSPCYNGGTCVDLVNGYKCDCPIGTTGPHCEQVVTAGCSGSPCLHGATCQDVAGDDSYTCTCVTGYKGQHCETNVDDCRAAECEEYQVCTDLINSYRCDCPQGRSGDRCQEWDDLCASGPCLNSGVCVHEGDRYTCECQQGYAGINCDIQADPCYPNPCLHSSICHTNYTVPSKYTCQCVEGFMGGNCEAKISSCLSFPCRHGGTCLENISTAGFTCQCWQNYTGAVCESLTEGCLLTGCEKGGSCIPSLEGHVCNCMPGWTGVRCQDDIDECANVPCQNGGQCVNVPGAYLCICNAYWTGKDCELDEIECGPLSSTCKNNGTCVEQIGAPPLCQCKPGTAGEHCETILDGCDPDPCQNNGQCTNTHGTFTCTCSSGYTGQTCETEINECELYAPCANSATCTDLLNAYTCSCLPGYTGVNCSLNIDDCDPDLCRHGGTCQDGVNEYTCLCAQGYTGVHCEMQINECEKEPCQNNATCVDQIHSFYCQCLTGYTGVYCETNVDDCEPSPCHHGGRCVDGVGDYTCVCPQGYGGKNCSEDVQECNSSPCLHGGICTEPVVGSYACQCPPGVHGNSCQEVTMATFDGQSLVSLPSLTGTDTRRKKRYAASRLDLMKADEETSNRRMKRQVSMVTLNFWFSTSVLEGLVLLARGSLPTGVSTHFAIFLKDEKLHVSQNLHGETITDYLDLSPTNQIVSHHVTVVITIRETNISLGSCIVGEKCHMTLTETLIGQGLYLNGPMVVGGTDQVDSYLKSKLPALEFYTGCFGNLTVNGEPVSLFPEFGTTAYNQSAHLPLAGCRSHDSCQPDFCTATGKCMDRWTDRYCSCIDGFIGPQCGAQNTVHFLPESFLHLKNYSKITSLSFRISANSTEGMIMYTLDLDMMALYIADSQLVMHLVVNGDDFVSRVGNLDNGDWYQVTLEFGQGIYKLHLTHETEGVAGSATGTVGNYLDVYTPLFMGQLHEHPAVNKWRNRSDITQFKSFTGCVQNLTINAVSLDFQSATPSVFGNDPRAPYPGCPRDQVCSTSPCGAQGTCHGGWGKSVCDCGNSLEGNFCETKVPVSFSGDGSHVLLQVNSTVVPFGDDGSFAFRTRDQTATLLFTQFYSPLNRDPSTSLEFGLYKGNVQVTVTTDKVTMVTFDADVADAEWHVVTWSRGHDLIKVMLDTRPLSLHVKVDPYRMHNLVDIYMGGKPFKHGDPSYLIGSLRGCINDLKFNGQNVLYLDDTQDGISVQRQNVDPGCHGDDFCALEPCPGNAVCEKLWNARECTCMAGWEGDSCETSVNDCLSNACMHGECIDGHLNYTCNCSYGYIGDLCDKMYNPCETHQCHTEGTTQCTFTFPAQYDCVCIPGWVGKNCSVNVNECESSPCLNNGQCKDIVNGFECDCPGYYFGARCEQLDICSSQPCFNAGSCQSMSNNTQYNCGCLPRYTGSQCQTYNFCYDSLCENNATCTYDLHGYTCDCRDGFYGVHCQFQDYCASRPCLNNGECFNDKESFRCLCSEFYSGTVCDKPVNRCNTQVCLNGATCFFNASNPAAGYECMCLAGFTGIHCETDIDECLSNPCTNGGTCHDSNNEQSWKFFPGYKCDCVDGYYGDQCQNETDECASMPCINNGTCIDLINSYKCDCHSGFSGYSCEIDVRGCSSNPCQNNAVCRVTTDSQYVCECANGYTGRLCDSNINDCAVHECINGATCIDGVADYMCQCFPGYSGVYCEHVVDACYSQPCLNNGECLYRGMCECENIVQDCGWHNESCQVEQCDLSPRCNTYTIPYTCDCENTGYTGDVCSNDIDECLNPSQCEHGGVCTNTVGGFTCDCSTTGYKGNRCEIDIDECRGPNPCFNGGACENFLGSYKCLCPAGWTGQTCGQLFDHCEGQPCRNHGNCINTISGFLCDCANTGFQGDTCEININDCAGNPCRNNGRCKDGINNYTCDCTGTGYHGYNCETETDHCEGLPCQHNGTCTDVGLTYRCDCSETGYSGKSCDLDIDECVTGAHECTGGATCLNTEGSYTCQCMEYFSGQFCEMDLRQTAETSSGESNLGVVIATVLIILAIVIAALIYAYWYLRKSRRMKGRYKPSHMEQSGPGVAPGIPLDKIFDPTNGERLI